MGFFKFLKRDKKRELEELDLPPEPPSVEELGEGMPELPEFPDFQEKISAPREMPNEMPGFDFTGQKGPSQEEFPSFPELEKEIPQMPEDIRLPAQDITMPESVPAAKENAQETKLAVPADAYPKIERRRLFTHERKALRERPSGKTMYIRVDRFKATLGSINAVKSDLRKSEETATKLESINSAKGRSSDRAKAQLEDLQRKLIFIDKTLFKGE